MKISKKEKYLLGILGVVLVGVLYYQFAYVPQVNKIKELKQSKLEKEAQYSEMMNTIATLDERKAKVKGLNQLIIDKSAPFYPKIVQENLILEIDKLLSDSGLKGTISFSGISVGQVEVALGGVNSTYTTSFDDIVEEYSDAFKDEIKDDKEEATEEGGQENSSEQANENNIENSNSEAVSDSLATTEQIKVSLSFNGEYAALKEFIRLVNENERKIAISNISLAGQGQGQNISGSMNLEFYALPKLGNTDNEYFTWLLNNTYGKGYPFSTSPAIGTTIEQLSNNENTYDFVMLAKPEKSDLPAVMIGQANDETNMSYLYSDNKNIENVEMVLIEKNRKYYFKYRVANSSYPMNYDSDGIEFIPSGEEIIMNIFSSKRISDDDKAGVKLTIKNKTNKTINVNVKNEDSVRPRVSIVSQGATVKVTNN